MSEVPTQPAQSEAPARQETPLQVWIGRTGIATAIAFVGVCSLAMLGYPKAIGWFLVIFVTGWVLTFIVVLLLNLLGLITR